MARVRCITEMGMGVDVHGRDATKAAKRAVSEGDQGLEVPAESGGDSIIIANAAVIVSLDDGAAG